MKLNKIFMLAGIAMLGFAMSSCSDDDNDYTPGEPVSADCPAVSFVAEETGKSIELDPTDPTEVTFTVTREKADAAASYNLTVLSNTDDVFVVPATVDFAAGAKEANVKATFNNAEVGKTYALEVALDDAVIDVYKTSTRKSFTFKAVRVKWNNLGKGQWIDDFWYGFWDEVEIFQRDDKPEYYRVKSVYTDDLVASAGSATGTYQDYFVFKVAKSGAVTWDTPLLINTSYQDTGFDIIGHLPSELNSSLAEDDAKSVATYDEEGNIQYLTIAPYWYIDDLGGGFGIYNLYLAFPGYDLASEMGL